MGFGSGQRVAFAGLVIGFLLCTTGCIAPFWQVGRLNAQKLASFIRETLPVDFEMTGMNGGLWWFCWELMGESHCSAYDFQDDTQIESWVVRVASALNVFLTLLCALVALSRTCCCTGGRTICHGIVAFIAGAAGIIAIGVFAKTASEGFGMKLKIVEFGWAFYVYIAGTGIVTIVSFLLCFASPDNPLTPMIINTVGGVFPNSRYARMKDDRLPLEETAGDMPANFKYPIVHSY